MERPSTSAPAPVHDAAPSFDRQTVEEPVFLEVLDEVVRIIEREGLTALFIGGIASSMLGRGRWSDDIDLLVRPEDAGRCLEALASEGFAVQETDPHWLFKASKRGVLVDVIFKSTGDIYLDDEMVARSTVREFHGRRLRVASPEDLLVMKAIAHSEATPRYWHDALSILSHSDLDWDYLLRRARLGPRRILSLLLYAQSNDLGVDDEVIRRHIDAIYGPDKPS